MPGMGGRELIERIRQQGLVMPVLSTSGYVLPEDKQTGAGYLQKPFTSHRTAAQGQGGADSGTVVD